MKLLKVLTVALCLSVMVGCSYLEQMPTDEKLISLFKENRDSFEEVIETANNYSYVERLDKSYSWVKADYPALPESERLSIYEMLSEIGISRGFSQFKRTYDGTFFTVKALGNVSAGLAKGYYYSETGEGLTLVESLDDGFPDGVMEGYLFVKITKNWYLFLQLS